MAFQFPTYLKVAGKLAGINWYKWGLITAIAVAYSGTLWGLGYHKASVHCEQEKTEAAEEKTRTIVKEVLVRVPVVQIREVESAKQRAEIAGLKEKLSEAIAKKPENPSCALTSDERDGFNNLFKKTRSPK